jgi:hypothetical protein
VEWKEVQHFIRVLAEIQAENRDTLQLLGFLPSLV